QLTEESGWPAAVARLRPAATPGEVETRLADLVTAATLRYLSHGHGQPVLLVHTATAPNAVRHTLPALPPELWAPSLTAACAASPPRPGWPRGLGAPSLPAAWSASAAIFAAYAPPEGAARPAQPALPAGPDAVAEVLDRAVDHGDEHVIKFTDTAAEVYTRTGRADALAAALHVGTLIPGPGADRN